MKKKRFRREVASLSLSFLDAVTCGFGAIILLLVITKVFEPIRLEESNTELDGLIVKYEQELRDILGETDRVRRQQLSSENEIEIDTEQIAALEAELTRIRAAFQSEQSEAEIAAEIAGQMATARQSLTEEMERLLGRNRPRPEDYKIGGIPVDSEYIIFIIDSSGSMRRYEWDRVVSTIEETLAIYPTVKGIQVMNDQGNHLLISTRGEWINDTAVMRAYILEELRDWEAFSTSNPRRGILTAIDQYYDPNKKISLYVYSDDFSTGREAINGLIREVDARNTRRGDGEKLVRIHAVAFPVYYDVLGPDTFANSTGADFGVMMRILCMRNGGTFVALPSRHRI
jgi:hypothetical protein